MSDEPKKKFQVLMRVHIGVEIEAKDQADAERLAELLAVHGSIPMSLRDPMAADGSPALFLSASVDDVDVADVEEAVS